MDRVFKRTDLKMRFSIFFVKLEQKIKFLACALLSKLVKRGVKAPSEKLYGQIAENGYLKTKQRGPFGWEWGRIAEELNPLLLSKFKSMLSKL